MPVRDADRDRELITSAVAVARAAVDDDVEGAFGSVAPRLDRARHVLDADHRSADDRAESMLDRGRAETASVRVDEAELERIGGIDLELDLHDLVAHRGEGADQREPRHVVVGGHLVDADGRRGVRLVLEHLEGDIAGDPSALARRTFGHEELAPLADEMAIPRRDAAGQPRARLRCGASVGRANGLLVVTARAPNTRPREGEPRCWDRCGVDPEPAARRGGPVPDVGVETLAEGVEHRQRIAAHVRRDVQRPEERGRDTLATSLGGHRQRRDRADLHRASPEPRLEGEEEGLPDDLVSSEREDEVVEAAEATRREGPPSLLGPAGVGERRDVDLEDPIEVVDGGGAEAQILDGHPNHLFLGHKLGHAGSRLLGPKAMVTEHAHSGQTPGSSPSSGTGLRLGGARADFVAGLGRKAADLRAGSAKVREKPDDITLREELRRKMHALSSAAKIMKFDAMDRAIAEALGTIDRTDLDAPLDPVDLDSIDQILEDLPALAWGDGDARVLRSEPVAKPVPTYAALVVGSAHIAEALLEEQPGCTGGAAADGSPETSTTSRPTFACESTPDAQAAFDLARTTEPDLVVLDADLDYATELVEALMDDPLTEATAIVVVGSFLEPGESARYVAMGVAKTLAKPTSKATLRSACETALESRRAAPVVAQSGVMPLPAHVDLAHGDRARARLRGPATEVRLKGRKIVVADDDPAVVWFLADVLKAAGCIVHEAFDGQQALELAYSTNPDLLLCDIMMPKVDGFSLCRKLRRDVALRDVPVILLSWKEDLLQRVRELGAGAAGYVRKESDTRAIVARIREALRPRAHIEMRLTGDSGEVRGRMDGISVRTLLEIVCATRPEARVTVRDASFNYEIEVRDGAPQRATRTSGDGTFLHGTKVIEAMLGVGAGRFTVVTSAATIEPQLDGNLASQLAKPIARARAVTSLLTGAGVAKATRIKLEEHALEDYLRAMPEIMRSIALRLAGGTSPRGLVLEGACDASLVEDLVCDLAARGVVAGIEDNLGSDLLGPELVRLAQHSDTRAKLAPRTPTPAPMPANECAADCAAPLCESPDPSDVGGEAEGGAGSLEEAVMRELANRSPEPGLLAASSETPSLIDPLELHPRTSPPPPAYEHEVTPPHDQILALSEATVVDTTYAERELSVPVEEASISLPFSESRAARTPLTAVTTQDEVAGLPSKRKAWPMVAFVATTGIVAWAVMHFSMAAPAPKHSETAPPAPVQIITPGDPEGVTYTTVVTTSGVPAGQGVLEISGPGDAVILVDGTDRGRGGVTLPLFAGKHDVRISGAAGDTAKLIDVRPALVAHVKF